MKHWRQFFLEIFDIASFWHWGVWHRIIILENNFHFLKFKDCFKTKMLFLKKITLGKWLGYLSLEKEFCKTINKKRFLLFIFQEVTSFVVMEKEVFTRCMSDILNVMNLSIRVVTTGSYVSVKELMWADERFRYILQSRRKK